MGRSLASQRRQILSLFSLGVQSDDFIKTQFLGEISIEKGVVFCPYRIDRRLPRVDKILLARALHDIPPEMSIAESLSAIPLILLFDSFFGYRLFSNQ